MDTWKTYSLKLPICWDCNRDKRIFIQQWPLEWAAKTFFLCHQPVSMHGWPNPSGMKNNEHDHPYAPACATDTSVISEQKRGPRAFCFSLVGWAGLMVCAISRQSAIVDNSLQFIQMSHRIFSQAWGWSLVIAWFQFTIGGVVFGRPVSLNISLKIAS